MNFKKVAFIFIGSLLIFMGGLNTTKSGEASGYTNLALEKNYVIDTPYQIDSHFEPIESGFADEGGLLTDGQYGGTAFDSGSFIGRIWQASRIVTLDLEEQSTIQKISLNVLQDLEVGISFPMEVNYSISEDGKLWEELGSIKNTKSLTDREPKTQMYTLDNINKVARYVKAEIPFSSWLFMDELEVLGTNDLSGDEVIPTPEEPNPKQGYPTPGTEEVGGINDQVLIYTGEWQYEPSDWVSFKKEDFKPYVTYVDDNFKSIDYMFDSFLFLPLAPQMDGTNFNPVEGQPTNMENWQEYIDRLFNDDYELSALNEAVKEAKETLSDDYQAKVVISIPMPRYDQSDFGDIYGTGESLNLNVSEVGEEQALENGKKVVQWFIDDIYERLDESDFEHIELTGFNWYTEYAARDLKELHDELVQWTGDYVRSKDAVFQWIPYYFSRGWQDWKELGFDSAIMQPNYYFHGNSTIDRMDTISQAAYEHGMGVEIELDDNTLQNESMRERYYGYLDKGKEYGFMNESYQVFYQQVKTLLQASESNDPNVRELYDKTYQYVKGTYGDPLKVLSGQLENYIAVGDVKHPLSKQLENSLKQAEHHFDNGRDQNGNRFLEKFLQQLNKNQMQKYISEEAKADLTTKVNKIIVN